MSRPAGKTAPCRHCKQRPRNQARGLCSRCYRDPAIRNLYPARDHGKKTTYTHCRNCGAPDPNRPKGLCWVCHDLLKVGHLYPSESPWAFTPPVPDRTGSQPEPEPGLLDECPGTEGRVAVLEARAAAGQALFRRDERGGRSGAWLD